MLPPRRLRRRCAGRLGHRGRSRRRPRRPNREGGIRPRTACCREANRRAGQCRPRRLLRPPAGCVASLRRLRRHPPRRGSLPRPGESPACESRARAGRALPAPRPRPSRGRRRNCGSLSWRPAGRGRRRNCGPLSWRPAGRGRRRRHSRRGRSWRPAGRGRRHSRRGRSTPRPPPPLLEHAYGPH